MTTLKQCKSDEILNKSTDRCVKRDGKIGKKILLKNSLEESLICGVDKIFNPKSNRCVKRDGKVGKEVQKLLEASQKVKSSPKKVKISLIVKDVPKKSPKTKTTEKVKTSLKVKTPSKVKSSTKTSPKVKTPKVKSSTKTSPKVKTPSKAKTPSKTKTSPIKVKSPTKPLTKAKTSSKTKSQTNTSSESEMICDFFTKKCVKLNSKKGQEILNMQINMQLNKAKHDKDDIKRQLKIDSNKNKKNIKRKSSPETVLDKYFPRNFEKLEPGQVKIGCAIDNRGRGLIPTLNKNLIPRYIDKNNIDADFYNEDETQVFLRDIYF
jgi:hypothetical protein